MTPSRPARIAATAAALSLAAAAAALVDEPIAFPHRGALSVAVLAGAAALAPAIHRRWATAALAALAAWTAWSWSAPWRDARAVWADLPAARAAGRHFVVGYGSVDEVRALSRAGLVGGVFLTRRNVAGRPIEAVAAEVAALQADRRAAGLPPLIVAADQEGAPSATCRRRCRPCRPCRCWRGCPPGRGGTRPGARAPRRGPPWRGSA